MVTIGEKVVKEERDDEGENEVTREFTVNY